MMLPLHYRCWFCVVATLQFAATSIAGEAETCQGGENCRDVESDIGALHLLQKTAAVLQRQSVSGTYGHLSVANGTRQDSGASRLSLKLFRESMVPYGFKFPFLAGIFNSPITTFPNPDLILATSPKMRIVGYLLAGVILLSLLIVLVLACLSLFKTSEESVVVDDRKSLEEEEVMNEFSLARYNGLLAAVVDVNDWMVLTFFPTWCVERGLSEIEAGTIISMMGLGMLVAAPFVHYCMPTLGGPSGTVLMGNRVYALTRLLCIGLIFLPNAYVVYAAGFVFLLIGATWSLMEVAACTWVLTSVPANKRTRAMGFMFGCRMLGSFLGPALGGILFSFGGLMAPFVLGFILLIAVQQHGKFYFEEALDYEEIDAFSEGSIIALSPVFISLVVFTILSICLCSQVLWQQVYMLSHYDVSTWEYGLLYSGLLVLMSVGMGVIASGVEDVAGSVPTIILGFFTMAGGYLIMGPSPVLSFLPNTDVWISIIGTVIWAVGVSLPYVVLIAFATNTAVAAGWKEMDASIQWTTVQIFIMGICQLVGPQSSLLLAEAVGPPMMCTYLALGIACICGGLGCLLLCVPYKVPFPAPVYHYTREARSDGPTLEDLLEKYKDQPDRDSCCLPAPVVDRLPDALQYNLNLK
jgi:MFS family permease